MAEGYTSFGDMFDGGGPGKSGPSFSGGGMVSAVGNAFARPSGSIARGEPDMRTGFGGLLTDMFDGGGFGKSGDRFSGGPPAGALMGGLLNALNVRPMGYEDRLGAMRPQMRPDDLQAVLGALALGPRVDSIAPPQPVSPAVVGMTYAKPFDYSNAVYGPYALTPEGARARARAQYNLTSEGGVPTPYIGYGPR